MAEMEELNREEVAQKATSGVGTTSLPMSRIQNIIRADSSISLCSKEAIFLISLITVSLCSLIKGILRAKVN